MKNKYFYPIFKLKAKSWIRYWLLKKTEFKGKLSEILTGFSFNLQNTLRQKFVKFEIQGHSEQESTSIADGDEYDSPSPEHEQPIKSCGDNIQLLDKSYYEQGSIDGTTGQDVSNAQNGRGSNYISVLPNTKYTLSSNTILAQLRLSEYGNNKSHIQRDIVANSKTLTITTTANTYYLRWSLNYDGSTVVTKDLIDSLNLKLEQGSIATPYSPYGMGSITEKIVNKNLTSRVLNETSSNFVYVDRFLKVKAGLRYYVSLAGNGAFGNVKGNNLYFRYQTETIDSVDGWKTGTDFALGKYIDAEYDGYLGIRVGGFNTYTDLMASTSIITDYVPHEEQTYTIPTQQPMRSIGDVRDIFFKNTQDSPYYDGNLTLNGWYERHLPYIASYNNEVLPLDVYNEVGGIKYCNEKSMSTTGQFSLGASVQYLDESNWNCLLCTQSQIDILENIPSTFAGQTNVFSIDEVEPHLKIQYWESDTNG